MPAVHCDIELEFPSEEFAMRVHRSVELDNAGYLSSEVWKNTLKVAVDAESLRSLIHTLDDFLSCVNIAEGIVRGQH